MTDPIDQIPPATYGVPPELAVDRQAPDRNLALELVRVTEAAAMAAARWVGRGDKTATARLLMPAQVSGQCRCAVSS